MEREDPNELILNNIIQARNLFKTEYSPLIENYEHTKILLQLKLKSQYQNSLALLNKKNGKQHSQGKPQIKSAPQNIDQETSNSNIFESLIKSLTQKKQEAQIQTFTKYQNNISKILEEQSKTSNQTSLVLSKQKNNLQMNLAQSTKMGTKKASSLRKLIKPKWHPPFKLYRVIVGHQGWVRGIAVSPCNTFFATGSVDRTIKFWDLASGQLKISLTGHINTVRGVQFSKNHPYLFSCGEDKSVKCWDLQMNKVIRTYHGHLSGVYCLKIHDGLGVLVTGGRDSTARVWDIRVRRQIHALVGHAHTVGSVLTQQNQPHVITGSYDSFVKLWDIGQGKCIKTLTNHKKSIRAMVQNPYQYTFATAASDNIKVWKCPEGQFLRNISGHNSIIDSMAVNQDGVLVSGGDDGTMKFWDWSSGYNYQQLLSQPQPGSIAAQNGIFSLTFDRSGSRLLSGQCDKTIKMYKQDETASQETHPIKQFRMQFEKK